MTLEQTCIVRQAGQDAFEPACSLLEQFFVEEGFNIPPDLIRARLSQLLSAPDNAVFLAWKDNKAVGVATISTSFGIEHGRSAELDDLYVLPEARGLGIARDLVDTAQTWARMSGCTVLLITVTAQGQEIHDLVVFYGKLGFQDEGRRILSLDM